MSDVKTRSGATFGSSSGSPSEHATAEELRKALKRQQLTFDLTMAASQMGTWRYTLDDNICVHDEVGQRLYGLTEARFLHDEEGVKAMIHPDDIDLMWERVAQALDPDGDGRYEVEYRVRQLDGSWRWLSAWGVVETEEESGRPTAIVGAGRDLTEAKHAESKQRLLLTELNHRLKNTLATVQAISAQSLKTASDLPSARQALEQRLVAMGKAHDLLTARTWIGADFADIVRRALEAFPPSQVVTSGPPVDIPSGHVLALSLALHELATNAAKHGALSRPDGRVALRWTADEGKFCLQWRESGGPPVKQPSRSGFGSRLLRLLMRDLRGTVELDYDPAGLRCKLAASL